MFGAVPASLLMDLAYANGYREQLSFKHEFPPMVYVPIDCLTSVTINYFFDSFGSLSSDDHPSFKKIREILKNNEYIETQSWWNGDRVLKPFYFNDIYLQEGDTFYCAAAWGGHKKHMNDRPYKPSDEIEEETVERCKHTIEMEF